MEPLHAEPVAVLLDGDTRDRQLLGGKGGALDDLVAWGLPVPPSGVVTTAGYRVVAAHPTIRRLVERIQLGERIDDEQIDDAMVEAVHLAAPPGSELRRTITDVATRAAGGSTLAVRSSATVEDLAASSFAGQYCSLLDVDAGDDDELLDAIGRVFGSLWHRAPCAYRRAFSVDERDVAMAAVLMRMVPADRAGVVFTVDPQGTPDSARIEVVEGLGESLVSGQRTPVPYVVDRHEPASDLPVVLRDALGFAMEAERRAGAPQDVEWAASGAHVWVVQSRPITVIEEEGDGFDDPVSEDELTTAAIGEMLPGVMAPLPWQLCSHLVEQAFRRVLDDLGLGLVASERTLLRRVRGRAALDFSVMSEMAAQLPGGASEELELQYFGSRRPGRPTSQSVPGGGRVTRIRHDLRVLSARRQAMEGADTVVNAVDALFEDLPDVTRLGDAELMAYRARLVDLGARAMADELSIAAVAASAFRRLELDLARHLGPERGTAAAERVTSLGGLTAHIRTEASAAFFAGPTWIELDLEPPIRRDGSSSGDELVGSALVELVEELSTRSSWGAGELRSYLRRIALRRLVADVVAQLVRREATKAAVLAVGGEVRRVHLEVGNRLVENGDLVRPGDVDLCSDPELRSALAGQAPSEATIARRGRWLERYAAEGPLPARFSGPPQRTVAELPSGDRLEGWATSPGRATGVARVLNAPTDELGAGEVLVATATDASWSPLFVRAGAIVLERGGPLSHASILARELGVPAVLNVKGATQLLAGHRVLVDGDAGLVVLINDERGADTVTAGEAS